MSEQPPIPPLPPHSPGEERPPSPRRHHHDYYDEKELQKQEEKQEEKQDEKREEKTYEEKYRHDPLGALIWAAILVWAGVILLASNLGVLQTWLTQITDRPGWNDIPLRLNSWSLVFLGVAGILFIEVIVRILVPEFRRPVLGTLILMLVLFGVGLEGLVKWELIWPFILIIIGVYIVAGSFFRRSR